ncbi:Uncharacterised protein [Mycobacteroides abscessus subsp. massiliense]|nr:Uncharacterised protein [Mycobacteroides abscessus subsp. massiliense]
MSDSEAPLTPDERLTIAALYTSLVLSQNRTVPGLLGSESPCYADLNRCSPETLSHKRIPEYRVAEGSETEKAC